MPVTLKDVARRAGVSHITASRAFSNPHLVAQGTRQRVLQAARELGYAPDLVARGLVRRQSPIIGMVVMDLSNPFITPIIDAAQEVARQHGYLLVVSQSQRQLELERASVSQFRQMHAAGVMVMSAAPDFAHLEALRAQGTPVAVIARRWPGGDFVTVDDPAGGRLAAGHLLRLGHRRLGYVALDEPGNTAVQARLQGYCQALEEAGAPLEPAARIYAPGHGVEHGFQAADAFVALTRRPSAMFVTSDRLAIGFVHRLLERGLRVPRDLAVVGYDDICYSEFLEVPLTTVAVPMYEIGRLTAEILCDQIEGRRSGPEPRQVSLPPQLVVRRSCGAPPTRALNPGEQAAP